MTRVHARLDIAISIVLLAIAASIIIEGIKASGLATGT